MNIKAKQLLSFDLARMDIQADSRPQGRIDRLWRQRSRGPQRWWFWFRWL